MSEWQPLLKGIIAAALLLSLLLDSGCGESGDSAQPAALPPELPPAPAQTFAVDAGPDQTVRVGEVVSIHGTIVGTVPMVNLSVGVSHSGLLVVSPS